MKPAMTGRLSNWARKPRRSRPQASSSSPEPSASVAASTRYSGEPGAAIGASTEYVMIEVIATGPTAWTMLLPNSA